MNDSSEQIFRNLEQTLLLYFRFRQFTYHKTPFIVLSIQSPRYEKHFRCIGTRTQINLQVKRKIRKALFNNKL
jgi:hypothetical protein